MKNLNENQINTADIKAIFKTAASSRENASGLGKFFKGLRKEKIGIIDLQNSWKEEGFPDDTRDIKALLLGHGFGEKEINKIFSEVFGSAPNQDTPDVPGQSPTLLKIVRYAKNNGLTQDLIDFMKDEYKFQESAELHGKLMIEDIRYIFSAIVQEERLGRTELIKQQDKIHLGRVKK